MLNHVVSLSLNYSLIEMFISINAYVSYNALLNCQLFSFSAKQHECDSPDGFCHDKCPYKNGTYPFWRLRDADTVPFLWTIKTLQMFESPSARFPVTKDPTKGYASTFFGPGKRQICHSVLCTLSQFLLLQSSKNFNI